VVVISFSNLEDPEIRLWQTRVVAFTVVTGVVIRGVCPIEAEELCMPQAGCSQEQAQGEEVLGVGDEVGVLDISYCRGKQSGTVRLK